MIGLWTRSHAYRAAGAELPVSTRLVARPDGAIAVVHALADAPADAAVVVLADPAPASGLLDDLPVPVVVDRPWLRADVAADAGIVPDAALYVAECLTPRDQLPEVLRDTVGWLRVLSGRRLRVEAVTATGGGVMALLDAEGRAATVMVTILDAVDPRPSIRAGAIGVERVEVIVDGSDTASVTVSSEAGSLRRPTRFESRQRVSLRRAIEAARGSVRDDLESLRHDEEIAAVIAQDITHGYSEHRKNRLP